MTESNGGRGEEKRFSLPNDRKGDLLGGRDVIATVLTRIELPLGRTAISYNERTRRSVIFLLSSTSSPLFDIPPLCGRKEHRELSRRLEQRGVQEVGDRDRVNWRIRVDARGAKIEERCPPSYR